MAAWTCKGNRVGLLATFSRPGRVVRCAAAIREVMRPLGLDVRAGVHTGEIETKNNRVAGIAVHIGARVASLADPSEILASRTVKDLVPAQGLRSWIEALTVSKGYRTHGICLPTTLTLSTAVRHL